MSRDKRTDKILNTLVGGFIIMLILWLVVGTKAEASEFCMDWSKAGERIMQARQEHEDKVVLVDKFNKADIPEVSKATFMWLIDSAYNVPMFNKIEDKIFIINKFGDEVFVDCLQKTVEGI